MEAPRENQDHLLLKVSVLPENLFPYQSSYKPTCAHILTSSLCVYVGGGGWVVGGWLITSSDYLLEAHLNIFTGVGAVFEVGGRKDISI